MARGDIKIFSGQDNTFQQSRIVGSGTAKSINAGEPTKEGAAGAVAIMVDADGTTSQNFSGVSASDSTDTVAAAGAVAVWFPLPGIIYAAAAKSAAAADTQAEIDALAGKRVVFDLTSSSWTIDTAASNAATNGVIIVGGNPKTSTIHFMVGVNVTKIGNPTTA